MLADALARGYMSMSMSKVPEYDEIVKSLQSRLFAYMCTSILDSHASETLRHISEYISDLKMAARS